MISRATCATILLALCAVGPAYADLKECHAIASDSAHYKIVLDDFALPSADPGSRDTLGRTLGLLRFHIEGQEDRVRQAAAELNRTLSVPLIIVKCDGRKPQMDGQEFTPPRATMLNDSGVVVEVWGKVAVIDGADPHQPVARAQVGFFMPPVQHYLQTDHVPALHFVAYPRAAQSSVSFDDEIESLPELSAFALAGLAVKAARATNYDLAVRAYAKAVAGVDEALRRAPDADLKDLKQYLTLAACRVRNSARGDDGYQGSLKMTPPEACATN